MISTVRREMVHLCIVLIISVTWAMYSISISLVERIRESIERFSSLPLSEFLINFGFFYMVGLIWLTHRRWKEADKKKKELHNIIESINPDLLLVVDLDKNIVMCNSSVQRMFGYSANEVVNQKTDMLYFDRRSDPTKRHEIFEVLKQEGFHLGLATGTRKDGELIPLEIISGRLSSGDGVVLLLRDITERRQAEDQKDAAIAANRAKGQFLTNMSHEIRTPMNAIVGMTELVLGTQLTAQQKDYLLTVQTSADSLLYLLNQVLDLSKIEAGELGLDEIDFNLRTTLENAADTLSVKAEEARLELICHIKPNAPTALVGDPVRLRQIVVNLAANAIKFTEDGQVTISVEAEKEEDSGVFLHFMVSDTGIGISPDNIEAIFEDYKQADESTTRKYGGTGLGLAISKQLVQMMGGKIWVESELGKGSTFHFTGRFELGLKEATEGLPIKDLDLSGVPVLILDHNPMNRLVLKEMTFSWGLESAEAADARHALMMLENAFEAGQSYRVLLLDSQLAGMDGFEMAKRVKESPYGANLKMILLTTVGKETAAAEFAKFTISGHLTKPVKQSELLDAITMALGHSTDDKEDVISDYAVQEAQRRLGILLVEDNPVNQKVAATMLEKQGHRVVITSNGREALEVIDKERIDLIMMDVQMPEMDGLEATELIRDGEKGNGGHIPIVAMTAHAMKGDRERCLAAGMDDYVSKPITAEELCSVIENLAHRSQDKKKEGPPPSKHVTPPAEERFDLPKAMTGVAGDRVCQTALRKRHQINSWAPGRSE